MSEQSGHHLSGKRSVIRRCAGSVPSSCRMFRVTNTFAPKQWANGTSSAISLRLFAGDYGDSAGDRQCRRHQYAEGSLHGRWRHRGPGLKVQDDGIAGAYFVVIRYGQNGGYCSQSMHQETVFCEPLAGIMNQGVKNAPVGCCCCGRHAVYPRQTHALIGVKGSPFAVNFHLQFTAYHHHVFNHPRLVWRGFTRRRAPW